LEGGGKTPTTSYLTKVRSPRVHACFKEATQKDMLKLFLPAQTETNKTTTQSCSFGEISDNCHWKKQSSQRERRSGRQRMHHCQSHVAAAVTRRPGRAIIRAWEKRIPASGVTTPAQKRRILPSWRANNTRGKKSPHPKSTHP